MERLRMRSEPRKKSVTHRQPMLGLLAAAIAALAGLPGPARAQEGQRWALLVGTDKYESEDISELRFAVADVKGAAQMLESKLNFPRANVFLMTSDQPAGSPDRPTSANVIKRFDELADKCGPDDTLVFYFSGHGFQHGPNKHFLATVDADPSSLDALAKSTIPLQVLKEKVSKIKARFVIFIVDACRNDPERGKGDNSNRMTDDFAKDLMVVARSFNTGIGGTASLFACSIGERAYEWTAKGHGVFSYYLLDGLSGSGADPDGKVTMGGLGDYIQKNVAIWASQRGKTQKPDLEQQGAARIVLGVVKGPTGVPAPTPAATVSNTAPPAMELVPATKPNAALKVVVLLPARQGDQPWRDTAAETEFLNQCRKAGLDPIDVKLYADKRSEWADEINKGGTDGARAVAAKVGADVVIIGEGSAEKVVPPPVEGVVSYRSRLEARAIIVDTAEVISAESEEGAGADFVDGNAARKALIAAARKLAPKTIADIKAKLRPGK